MHRDRNDKTCLEGTTLPNFRFVSVGRETIVYQVISIMIAIFYVLVAMIRLAYFNVLEEEDENRDESGQKVYTGLPVTSAALVFPAVLLIHIFVKADLTLLYFGVMIVMGFLFISKIQIRKPENRQIALMILLGIVEFAALAIVLACVRR